MDGDGIHVRAWYPVHTHIDACARNVSAHTHVHACIYVQNRYIIEKKTSLYIHTYTCIPMHTCPYDARPLIPSRGRAPLLARSAHARAFMHKRARAGKQGGMHPTSALRRTYNAPTHVDNK